ncbi:hypothetical protein [Bradyrhizobium sp. SZCCHNR3015]|uniref:hypothetical protein n=1 Tax=Bradyrhizobium sp. SZCCHNR3015 TaxID=3057395 RepID=UPI0029163520|nr:hypothetical protein [Bradyrhizobium sp. SZCCHNR3015]
MTPADYVTEIVIPTVRESRDNRKSRRHAYLACIVTFHIKDHLEKVGVTGVTQKMRTACPGHFDLVRGVCNGTKHVATNQGHVIPFAIGGDYYRPPAFAGVMMAGLSMLGDTKGARVVRHNDTKYDLYGSAKAVLAEFKRQFPNYLDGCDLGDC